ncbi:hypothetical protein CYMTET_31590, partial [Cymbomonas tetramitiformis]
ARLEALELQEAQEQSAVGSAPQSPGDVVAYEEWRARQAVLQEEAPHPVTESSPPPLISEVIPAGDSLHQSLSSVTEAAVKEKKPKPSASSLRQGFFAPAPPRSTAQRKVASDHGDKTAQQAGVPFVGKIMERQAEAPQPSPAPSQARGSGTTRPLSKFKMQRAQQQ